MTGTPDADRADVFVLTAIEVEYRAVTAYLGAARWQAEERGAVYEYGEFEAGHGSVRVAVQLAGPGNEMAATLVDRAIARLRPAIVLLVGVAGGRRDVALGDVVAAECVYGYETGKDGEHRYASRMKTWHGEFGLVQRARAVAAQDRWQHRISPAPERLPAALVGPIAAGGKVVGHERSATGRLLDRVAGDALAVEMEGIGFLAGAAANHGVRALVIRGISDLLGDKSAEHDVRWQPVAARHAAAFAFELLSGLGPTPAPAREPLTAVSLQTGVRQVAGPPSARELGELADLLLSVPGLSTPSSWQQLLDVLPAFAMTTSRQNNARFEAISLLRTCALYGHWTELTETLDVLWPGVPAIGALKDRLRADGLM